LILKRLLLNDNVILFLIILNAVIIFIGGFDLGESKNVVISMLDNLLSILFLIELIIKLKEQRIKYFEYNWNKLDFILILFSIPALLAFVFRMDINDFSFLLVFRVMRVFKSFRFLKFIPGIDHLIRGTKRAIKSSIIVIFGFIIYIFIIGIFSFYLFKESSPEYFNNPLISLYSTFKIFTIEGWFEIPEEVTKSLSPIASFFTFLFFIFVFVSFSRHS
jgi:voltage-gated sodium channel